LTGETTGEKAARGKAARAGAEALTSLSAAAPEVSPDVKSGSADRRVPGESKNESSKENTGEEETGDEGEDEEGEEVKGDEDRHAAPRGSRCMDPTDTGDPELLPKRFPRGKKRKMEGGKGRGSLSSPANV